MSHTGECVKGEKKKAKRRTLENTEGARRREKGGQNGERENPSIARMGGQQCHKPTEIK
jgi:hypothetical protein